MSAVPSWRSPHLCGCGELQGVQSLRSPPSCGCAPWQVFDCWFRERLHAIRGHPLPLWVQGALPSAVLPRATSVAGGTGPDPRMAKSPAPTPRPHGCCPPPGHQKLHPRLSAGCTCCPPPGHQEAASSAERWLHLLPTTAPGAASSAERWLHLLPTTRAPGSCILG